ncbi:MAG: hypothetical protein RIQ55_1150 [Pseudomonadota bacterium]|jgi:hypothetical protein
MTNRFLYPAVLVVLLAGCGGPSVTKNGDNLYAVSEKSQPTQAAAEHIPDPAIDDLNVAARDYCNQNQQQVKVKTFDQPQDPTIRRDMFKMTFSCVAPDR